MDYARLLEHIQTHGKPEVTAAVATAGEITPQSFDAVFGAIVTMNDEPEEDLNEHIYVPPADAARLRDYRERFGLPEVGYLIAEIIRRTTDADLEAAALAAKGRLFNCGDCLTHFAEIDACLGTQRVAVPAS